MEYAKTDQIIHLSLVEAFSLKGHGNGIATQAFWPRRVTPRRPNIWETTQGPNRSSKVEEKPKITLRKSSEAEQ